MWSTENDALDANTNAVISGGSTLLLGTVMPDGGLDADFDSAVGYTGGTLVALGGENNTPQAEGSLSSYVSIALVEESFGRRPFMRVENAADGANPNVTGDKTEAKDAPAEIKIDNERLAKAFGNEGADNKIAGKTIAVAATGSNDVIAAVKVPADYTGGGNMLILSEKIQKDTVYQAYIDGEFTASDNSWFNDALFTGKATISGTPGKEGKGGEIRARQGFGPGPGGPGGGPGGKGGPGGRRGHGHDWQLQAEQQQQDNAQQPQDVQKTE